MFIFTPPTRSLVPNICLLASGVKCRTGPLILSWIIGDERVSQVMGLLERSPHRELSGSGCRAYSALMGPFELRLLHCKGMRLLIASIKDLRTLSRH